MLYKREVKVVPVYAMKAVDGDDWSTSRLGRFTRDKEPCTQFNRRGYFGPRAGLDTVEKSLLVCRIVEPLPYSLWRIPCSSCAHFAIVLLHGTRSLQ